ncbi:MAG: succinate--CoA ligase subunit alpha [Spiribacter salinus]|uniref:Succinate--CoA ligase subunit alpha n=1 Tax=Spiribacter salinus TaxID=1335746 RepID=A0A540VVM3_9GAMM|nr:MAG: succinate--CoA ligase subunit alpha [Spiribacter salinus]
MAILVTCKTRIVIQGMTGHTGRNLTTRLVAERSPVVCGVSPGRGGQQVEGLPVLDSCYQAVREHGVDASFISVPAALARDAALEAIDAGIRTIVVYAEGVPVHDALEIQAHARLRGARLLGPNAAGCISPGEANLSDLGAAWLSSGSVGIVSKSGTLTYEVIEGLKHEGLGQSSVVCLGGDPVVGMKHADVLQLFEADPDTHVVVLIGEIGGRSELDAAAIVNSMKKPVVAYIAGRHAPSGKRMGHAGALMGSSHENALGKQAALSEAGAVVVESLVQVAGAVGEHLPGNDEIKASR